MLRPGHKPASDSEAGAPDADWGPTVDAVTQTDDTAVVAASVVGVSATGKGKHWVLTDDE